MPSYPAQDKVAIVGVGATGFSRNSGRSILDMATDAAVQAIRDAGLGANDIDGLAGTVFGPTVTPTEMSAALGLPAVTYASHQPVPIVFSLMDAMGAILSGACKTVLVWHTAFRSPRISSSAGVDAIRASVFRQPQGGMAGFARHGAGGGYDAWAMRYLATYGVHREGLGLVAVNSRSGAAQNPLAVWRDPLTLEDYYAARMIREPLGLLDMDTPVDGADAFVLTTAERAADLPKRPVLIHAASYGLLPQNGNCGDLLDLDQTAHDLVATDLRRKSELWVDDADVLMTYEGFTIIALNWLEALGCCGRGEATAFLQKHWDAAAGRALINGRVRLNPHGGSLSEGGSQGSGHVREAVLQLRGDAEDRQVMGAKTAVLGIGGLYMNAQGMVLRSA